MNPNEPERIYHYKIDTEGRLWIEGTELTDPQVLKFFMRRMEKLPNGKFRVLCMGETNLIEAEDVPYVVQSIDIKEREIELVFPGNFRERLDPNTLHVGKNHILYCQVRNGEWPARFHRKPYFELARLVEKNRAGDYLLKLGGKTYPIQGVQE